MAIREPQAELVVLIELEEPESRAADLGLGDRATSIESGWDTLLHGGIPEQIDEDWRI